MFVPYYSRFQRHRRTVILRPQETENVHPLDNEHKPSYTPSLAACSSTPYWQTGPQRYLQNIYEQERTQSSYVSQVAEMPV